MASARKQTLGVIICWLSYDGMDTQSALCQHLLRSAVRTAQMLRRVCSVPPSLVTGIDCLARLVHYGF